MCRNTEMYGAVDMDALAEDVIAKIKTDSTCMALTIVAMVAAAQEELVHDAATAAQTLNRVQFLINRCCPLLHPELLEAAVAA